jgi:hypothetical protein
MIWLCAQFAAQSQRRRLHRRDAQQHDRGDSAKRFDEFATSRWSNKSTSFAAPTRAFPLARVMSALENVQSETQPQAPSCQPRRGPHTITRPAKKHRAVASGRLTRLRPIDSAHTPHANNRFDFVAFREHSQHRGTFNPCHGVFSPRSDSHHWAEWRGLQRLHSCGRPLGASSDLHDLRLRRMLRLIEEQARLEAFSGDEAPHRALGRSR